MKTLILGIATLLSGVTSFSSYAAGQTMVPTIITCQQDEGDQWIEVGIVLNDGPGLRALVVAHDADRPKSAVVIANRQVFRAINKKTGESIYSDSAKTIELIVSRNGQRLVGRLSLLQDGPGGFTRSGLACIERSAIKLR